jgi:hypothetical protein
VVDVIHRITTSFIGLSRVASFNFADAIANAALKNSLPRKAALSGYACFSKTETPKADLEVLDRLYELPGLVSPPFPVQDSETGCALVSAEGNSLDEACLLLEEAKKRVLDSM